MSQTTQISMQEGVRPEIEGDFPMSPIHFSTSSPRDISHLDGPATLNAKPSSSNIRTAIMNTQLCGINFATSGVTGLLTVGLPVIATDLALGDELYFWPLSVYVLAIASTILLAGSVADVLGHREMDLVGSFLLSIFILACGFAKTGSSFVAFRAIQGLAMSLHLSSSVGIIANALPRGRGRNIAFSCLPISMSLGYSSGLVLGGVFVDSIGWRAGLYVFGGLTALLSVVGFWALPPSVTSGTVRQRLARLATDNDWVGALIASAFMALLSYTFAVLSADISAIRNVTTIVLICVVAGLVPAFFFWMRHQVKLGRSALIPNSMWQNTAFTSICLTVALSFAVLGGLETFANLFFQNVQHLSALQASIRILPSLVFGAALNLTTGILVDKVQPVWLVTVSSILCAGSPLLLALINPGWPYWTAAFPAQLLQPISADVLFTVGLIVVSELFPEKTQALAGAVFNTASQFGQAIGLCIMQVVYTLVSQKAAKHGASGSDALMAGYRASFWTMFAFMVSCVFLGAWGLRKTHRVGSKID